MPAAPRAPGPSMPGLVRYLRVLRRDRIAFFWSLWQDYGPLVRIPLPGWGDAHLLTRHEDIQHVLQTHNRNYRKSELFNVERKASLGESLLTTEGSNWFRLRKLVQPAFMRTELLELVPPIAEVTRSVLDGWASRADTHEPFDIAEELTNLTLRIASRSLFGIDLGQRADPVRRAFATIVQEGSHRMAQLWRLPLWVPIARHRRFKHALGYLDGVVRDLIRQRREDGCEGRRDMLSRLMLAVDPETGALLSDEDLRNEVMTFLVAGHESTASGLAWATWLLATHPEQDERLRAEVRDVLGERDPAPDDLHRLGYLDRVVQETLRLYPPSWLFDRESIEPDVVGGFHIPARSAMLILPWIQHRHPEYWDDPDRFDPDRWLPERSAGRPAFAFCPFGGGPRLCVGNRFAPMEMQIILAMLAQRYRVHMVPGHPIELFTLIALRPKHGLRVTLEPAGARASAANQG